MSADARLLQMPGGGKGGPEDIPQPAISRLKRAQLYDIGAEALPSIVDGQRILCGLDDLFKTGSEDLLDQHLSRRKPAIEGCNPNAGVARDVLKRNVQPMFSEKEPGRADYATPIFLRITAQRTP